MIFVYQCICGSVKWERPLSGCVFVSPIHGYTDTQKTVRSFFLFAAIPLEGVNLGLSKVKNLNFRGYVKFCTRPTICRKKSNLSICRQVLDLSICRFFRKKRQINGQHTTDLVIWDTKSHLSICRHVDRLLICRSVDRSNRQKKLKKLTYRQTNINKSWKSGTL